MPLEPLPQTPPHASVDAPSNASRNALTEIISSLEDRTLAVSAAAEQILTLNANQQRGSALHERHQQSGLQQQFREAKGKESSKQRPDAGCIVSGGITRGMTTAAEQQKREPASEGASPKAAAAARPKAVSLLAQVLSSFLPCFIKFFPHPALMISPLINADTWLTNGCRSVECLHGICICDIS